MSNKNSPNNIAHHSMKVTQEKKLNILYTNIRSLGGGNFEQLQTCIQRSDQPYDVVALSETWVTEKR
jgi:hypothetical protein